MDTSTLIPEPPSDRFRQVLDGIVGVLFLLGISAPAVDMVVRDESARSGQVEFRAAAERPGAPHGLKELEAWPERYTDYFRDSFGLRDKLIRWHNGLLWFGLGESPTDQLVVGADHWTFYTANRSIETYRGAAPFGKGDLAAWRRQLEGRRDWLAARGIDFLYVIAPNKSTLYEDKMPARLDRIGPTRREQFFDYMRESSSVHVLDLLPALRAERTFDDAAEDDFTYNRYGTHWTDRGALAGYRAICAQLGILDPATRDDFAAGPDVDVFGDSWVGRLYLEGAHDETFHTLRPKVQRKAVLEQSAPLPARASHYVQLDTQLSTAAVFHDSFGPLVNPLLAQHFSSLYSFWDDDFRTDWIVKADPDVVIQIYVERSLVSMAPSLQQELGQERLEQEFAASDQSLLVLEPDELAGALRTQGTTELMPLPGPNGGVGIATHRGTDLVVLPSVRFPAGTRSILMLDITSPWDTTSCLFVPRPGGLEFTDGGAYDVHLKRGRSKLLIDLGCEDLETGLLLRMGLQAGRYALHRVELRAIALSAP